MSAPVPTWVLLCAKEVLVLIIVMSSTSIRDKGKLRIFIC